MNNYFVIARKCNGQPGFEKKDRDQLLAQVVAVPEHHDIISALSCYPGIFAAECHPKWRAHELANAWNESFKRNGTYAF